MMESAFAFDSRAEVLKVTVIGRVDSAPLLALMATLRRLGEQLQPRAVVYDCSAIEGIDFEPSFMNSLAGLRPVFDRRVLGVILASQEYIYGIARMYQGMTAGERPNVHVVRNWVEVQSVLGLAEPPRYAEVPVSQLG